MGSSRGVQEKLITTNIILHYTIYIRLQDLTCVYPFVSPYKAVLTTITSIGEYGNALPWWQ